MLLVRRTVRRVSGFLWTLWYLFLTPFKWLRFKRAMGVNGFSDRYLWRAFTYLAGLDMDESMVSGDLDVYGCGYFLEIKSAERNLHATVQQIGRRTLVVHLWRPEEREVTMEYGVTKTHWFEVYRTGRVVEPTGLARVYLVLRQLYGDGEKK